MFYNIFKSFPVLRGKALKISFVSFESGAVFCFLMNYDESFLCSDELLSQSSTDLEA